MVVQVTHRTVATVPDWTQAVLDSVIAGNPAPLPPAGTSINGVILPQRDWNDDHIITGLDTEYARLDGTNQPFTDIITVEGVASLESYTNNVGNADDIALVGKNNQSLDFADDPIVQGTDIIVVGHHNIIKTSNVTDDNIVNFGVGNTSQGTNAITLGIGNTAGTLFNLGGTSIGRANTAAQATDVAIGLSNSATGSGSSTSIGTSNTATNSGTSVGISNTSSAVQATAIGTANSATAGSAAALGYGNTASAINAASIGISNNGTGINIGRLNTTSGTGIGRSNSGIITGIGLSNTGTGASGVAIGSNNIVNGTNGVAMGYFSEANGSFAFSMGLGAIASTINSVSIGYGTTASANNALALGFGTNATAADSGCFGYDASYTVTNSTANSLMLAYGTGNTILMTATKSVASVKIEVPDQAYGAGWNGDLSVPTKNAVYDKIQTISGGAVSSVNGQTGAVVLDADDISDASTTNKWTNASDISKLAGIQAGAEVNVNADWSAVSGDAEILNKPTILSVAEIQTRIWL